MFAKMQGLSIDRLSIVVASIQTFYISMRSFNLDKVVALLRLFPCMENLFLEVLISKHYIESPYIFVLVLITKLEKL